MKHVLTQNPDFRRLFIGSSVSLLGSSVTTVALPLTAVTYLHASPVQMGILGAAGWVPNLILGLLVGVWVSRMPYKPVLVVADLVRVLLLGSIPVLAAFGILNMWHLYAVVILAGVCSLFETVTAQSFTPSLVPREQLLSANSAIMLSNTSVNTTGSVIGGFLVSVLTAPLAIAADAVSFLLSALFKVRIRTPGASAVSGTLQKQPVWPDILEGLRAVFAHPIVRAVTISATLGALAGQMQNVVIVLYLVRDVGLSNALIGVAIAISGAAGILGAFIATPLTARVGPGPAFIIGQIVAAAAGIVLAAVSGPPLLAFAILTLAQILRGTGPSLYGIHQQTFRQTLIAPALLTRVNATWRFLVFGMQPIGALLGGLLGSAINLRVTLLISSGVMILGITIAILSPLRSLIEPAQKQSPEKNRLPAS